MELEVIRPEEMEWGRELRNKNSQFFYSNWQLTREEFLGKTREYHPFYVINVEGRRVGTISVTPKEENWYEIGSVLIEENLRGSGLWREVMAEVEARHSGNYCLEVLVDNQRAIKAYEKVGFVKMGDIETKGHKAIRMEKRLTTTG